MHTRLESLMIYLYIYYEVWLEVLSYRSYDWNVCYYCFVTLLIL